MSASPAMMGSISFAISCGSYCASASVLTMMSAPSARQAWSPVLKAVVRLKFRRSLTMWSTPAADAAPDRVVLRTVVAHEHFDLRDAVERARDLANDATDGRLLVIGGDHDDELQPESSAKAIWVLEKRAFESVTPCCSRLLGGGPPQAG